MKTNFINLTSRFVIETGKILVYELDSPEPVFDEEGKIEGFETYSFSKEVVDVCTGEHFGWDGSFFLHLIGTPVDTYMSATNKQSSKRGHHSCSNNKKAQRFAHIRS